MTRAVALLVLFAASHVVFATWPQIDIAASRLFWSAETGFALEDHPAIEAARHAIWNASIVLCLAALLAWPAWIALGHRRRVPARIWGFVVLTYLLGPGLMINGILKTWWGRARPDHVTQFNGEDRFTPAFQMSGECESNCSFVSGEGAAAVALALLVGSLAWPHLRPRARAWFGTALALVALTASAARLAAGRHFVSDIWFGGLLTAFVVLGLFHWLRIREARLHLSAGALRHDVGLIWHGLSNRACRSAGKGGSRLR